MPAAYSLIPGLDDIVEHGDPQRRAKAIQQISELFVQGAGHFRPEHVNLFDGILTGLVPETTIGARAELAERLAAIPNAPPTLVNQLVRADEIVVAGPLLRLSPQIDEPGREELYARASAEIAVPDAVRRWQDEVHKPGIYDLEVDTSLLTPYECAEAIRQQLDIGIPDPSAFERIAGAR